MPRYGIISISPHPERAKFVSFDHLYQGVGMNTGNLVFTNAVWRQIGGDKSALPFAFDAEKANAELDAVIIPAANWINERVDFSHVAEPLERLKIPVVVIGLGAQSASFDVRPSLPKGTQRFLDAAFERSESVSVRGPFTANVLDRMGYRNIRVTGCPSLYNDASEETDAPGAGDLDPRRLLMHATRYTARYEPYAHEDGIDRRIFRSAFENDVDLLYQSELEELALLFDFEGPEVFDDKTVDLLRRIYNAPSWHALRDYVFRHGKAYLNVAEWRDDLRQRQFVYGTRLHNTILALNAGVRAYLLWHDSRTREIAEFAAIPSMEAAKAGASIEEIRDAYSAADASRFLKRRADNLLVYKAFLEENRLEIAG